MEGAGAVFAENEVLLRVAKGFTLPEMLIVIVIVVLVAIAANPERYEWVLRELERGIAHFPLHFGVPQLGGARLVGRRAPRAPRRSASPCRS